MKVSINWLKEYIDLSDLSVEEIANCLTMAGLEAEGISRIDSLENVVTAKVIKKEKHPNADKLNVCVVSDGEKEYQVVCGAPNVEAGQIVPFAKIGAVLCDIKIKEAKLRGVDSFGMICSERELGISQAHSGIMVLPSDTALGKDINDIIGADDSIVEFNVTPNRPDWLSIIGIARELSAIIKRPLKIKEYQLKESSEKVSDLIDVKIEDKEKCPAYFAKIIKGVKIGPSPFWMQAKLRSAGVRPINNIVDVTNYVLMEWGQPLHAFDIRNIEKEIIVRCASEGEKIVALDGKEYTLNKDMLVIADIQKPLAIAGVMGGEYTSVMDDTETVVLECAYFEPSSVRKTSKKLGLSSDASYRYERGIDYGATRDLADYAAFLIAEICGGVVLEGTVGSSYIKNEKRQVVSRYTKINNLLGTNYKIEEMKEVLDNLLIKTDIDNNKLISLIPTFRQDIYHEWDIAEEVARIIGYDKIGAPLPQMDNEVDVDNTQVKYMQRARHTLEDLGYNEVLNFAFLGADYLSLFDKDEAHFVKLLNPISQDMAWMRTYLFPSLIKNMQTNKNIGYNSIKLFEISNIYLSNGKDKLACEKLHLSLGVMGDYYEDTWIKLPKLELDNFYYLKGACDNLFAKFNLICEYERLENCHFLHPGKSATLSIDNKNIGFIGALHPDILEKLDIKSATYIAEIDFSLLIDIACERSSITYKKFSRFPSIQRDLALIVKDKIGASNIIKKVKDVSSLITDVIVFDVFTGGAIESGHKSIAIRILFNDIEKTLRDEDINPIIDDILLKLKEEYDIRLR